MKSWVIGLLVGIATAQGKRRHGSCSRLRLQPVIPPGMERNRLISTQPAHSAAMLRL